jgi:DNA-binding transcriptional MerR regulator
MANMSVVADRESMGEEQGGHAPLPEDSSPARPSGKSVAAFRTISEVSVELDVPQHVLRFWETKFTQLRPLKRGGGRRYYRPEDVALLRRIHGLLYKEGYTIKGVQRVLRTPRKVEPAAAPAEEALLPTVVAPTPPVPTNPKAGPGNGALLHELLGELRLLRSLLD